MINGSVAAIPGIGTVAVVATGGVTGVASYETKNALNGNMKYVTLSEHESGSVFNGAIGALGNYAGVWLVQRIFTEKLFHQKILSYLKRQ